MPAEVIQLEEWSRTTVENALYTAELMNDYGWEQALIVSDGYHLLRARILFEQQAIQVVGTSSAQVTTGRLPFLRYLEATQREVVSFYWHGVKTAVQRPFSPSNRLQTADSDGED